MNTPYSNIYNRFLVLVSKDTELLGKGEKSKTQIEKKLKYLLDDAIAELMLRSRFDSPADFTDKDDALMCFNFELTLIEEKILSSLMMELYVDETTLTMIRKLKADLHYTDEEIKVFCPANSLSAFESSYDRLKQNNDDLIISYKTRDRETHKKNHYGFLNEDCLGHDEYDYESLIKGSES